MQLLQGLDFTRESPRNSSEIMRGENDKIVAGIEFGGTKTIALIAHGQTIFDEHKIETTSPEIVLSSLIEWLRDQYSKHIFESIGIASFGPICLDRNSPHYGFITTTPKPNWGMTDVVKPFADAFNLPIGFDTDVNGAALAEYYWGAAQNSNCSIYVTIGTGIGGGVIINGRPLHGFLHPEMGHIKIARRFQLEFKGNCPFHSDCIEGLASGHAIFKRTGLPAHEIAANHEVWDWIADEIGEFVTNLILNFSPQIIALGGGVMKSHADLIGKIRKNCLTKLSNYIAPIDEEVMEKIIAPPALGDLAGPLGAIALGLGALNAAI